MVGLGYFGGGESRGKAGRIVAAPNFNHFEMAESVGNPYGPNGRAALALMKLSSV
jgi:arylformamidase